MAEEQAPEFQASPGRDVFISYASQESAVAESVCSALEQAGIRCWVAPRDVIPGAFYGDAIVHAIDATKATVLILSQHAADSPHVLREVERASSKRHPVVSLRTDHAPLPAGLEYFLNTSQWLDASDGHIARAMPKLVAALRLAVERPATPSAAIAATPTAGGSSRTFHSGSNGMPRRTAIVALSLLAVAIGGFAAYRSWVPGRRVATPPAVAAIARTRAAERVASAAPEHSVAVLPFADMSEKHDQEYFGDGMAEEILDLLAKIPGLHVPARTSSFYFKGKSEDIPTIARRLMVANVLEGSVRKSGNHVRVRVQLVRADNGYHLWSETYDRTLDDLFKVQDEIAGEVVKALKVSMDTNAAPRAVPTNSAEAHRLLLQGQFWFNRGAGDKKRAAGYYQQAIDIDPDFAAAWAGLSRALNNEGQSAGQSWQQFHEPALRAAERALALDPKLPEAHVALAAVHYWLDWDWVAANTEYERARSLDPDDPHALNGAGLIASVHGRLGDAVRLWDQAAARDPLNQFAYSALANTYYAMGLFTEALAAARKGMELAATIEGDHAFIAQLLLAAGQKNDALAEAEKESDPGSRAYALVRTYIALGRRSDADAALAEVEKHFSAQGPYGIATLYALRGDRDQAFSWLNRAYQQHDVNLIGLPPITVEPDMRNLHGDPRWVAFLRKMKLP